MPAFRAWFSQSKVVDADGQPLVVYHGTAADFSVFGSGRGAIYFTSDAAVAAEYASQADVEEGEHLPNIIPAYLSIQNPLVIDEAWAKENLDWDGSRDWTALDETLFQAEQAGHDGAILRGVIDYSGINAQGERQQRPYDQFVAFRPEQIKSAIGNRGTYELSDADIRMSIGGRPRERGGR